MVVDSNFLPGHPPLGLTKEILEILNHKIDYANFLPRAILGEDNFLFIDPSDKFINCQSSWLNKYQKIIS